MVGLSDPRISKVGLHRPTEGVGINSHLNLLVFVGTLAGCSRVLGPGRLPGGRAAWLAGCRLLGATGPQAKVIYIYRAALL